MINDPYQDPFLDAEGMPRRLLGAAVLSGSPKVAEMAGRLGFDTIWIELEHGGTTFSEAETLCIAAEAGGAVPSLRLPDHNRHHVLRSLEVGAKIVIVPMVNNANIARELVRWGKFPPLGERGFNTRSRGLNYGMEGVDRIAETFARANAGTHLIAQIETIEAAENLDAILAIPGLSGILVGPGDLSTDLGKPGKFADPQVMNLVTDLIRRTRAHGKHAGIMTFPCTLMEAALGAGCDLCYFAGDMNDLVRTWRGMLGAVSLLPSYPNLAVARTMSKAFAMAGGRVGYLAASKQFVDALRIVRLPYHLSAVTQAVARAALRHSDELLGRVEQLRIERDETVDWLRAQGLRAVDSDANFVLFGTFADRHAVWQALLDDGVLIRETGPDGWLRVSIGTSEEMAAFRASLERILKTDTGRLT